MEDVEAGELARWSLLASLKKPKTICVLIKSALFCMDVLYNQCRDILNWSEWKQVAQVVSSFSCDLTVLQTNSVRITASCIRLHICQGYRTTSLKWKLTRVKTPPKHSRVCCQRSLKHTAHQSLSHWCWVVCTNSNFSNMSTLINIKIKCSWGWA